MSHCTGIDCTHTHTHYSSSLGEPACQARALQVPLWTSLTVSEVQEEELDYMDDLDICMESEVLAEHDHDNDQEQEQEDDITSEEGWLKRQCALDENREQREKMKLKLERQQQLAEAKLKEEEERLELTQMEQEIKDINARRLVTKSSTHVQSRIWKKLVSGSKTTKHFKSPKIGQWASKGVNAVSCRQSEGSEP